MKVYGLWGDVNIQGKGKGNLRLEERMGCYWLALYEEPSLKDSFREEVDIAVDALIENPEAAAGAVLTAAASGAVKAVAVALGADRSAVRHTPGFENESAKEFSQSFAKSRKMAVRKRLIFEKELDSLSSCTHFGNTVSIVLDCTYRLTFENPKSGENSSREFVSILESMREKIECSQDQTGKRLVTGRQWFTDHYGTGEKARLELS